MPRRRKLDLKDFIRDIPDFPKPGIMFKDITPLLKSPKAFASCIGAFADQVRTKRIDTILAVDARGFLFAAPLAMKLGIGIVPMRKKGKLPYKTLSHEYQLEYGTDTVEIHSDAVANGDKVLIVDDVLATGGTARAAVDLISRCGGKVVGCAFVVELSFLGGRKKLEPYRIFSQIKY